MATNGEAGKGHVVICYVGQDTIPGRSPIGNCRELVHFRRGDVLVVARTAEKKVEVFKPEV